MTDILPPHSGRAEKALAGAVEEAFAIPVEITSLWRPRLAPDAFLPWLAWALSVDEWNPDWPEAMKREVIALSIAVHRAKGTLWAIKRVLATLGYADAIIIEHQDLPRYGRGWTYGRAWRYGPTDPHWADYWVETMLPLDKATADMIATRLADTAPARCRLRAIRTARAHRRAYGDGGWTYGRAVTFGSVYIYGERNG